MEDLYSACLFGDYLAVQKALDLKENPNLLNDKTTYPLSVASLFGYESIAELLLRSGASVTVKDSDWLTPLHWACFGGYEHIVSLLLDNRAEINSRDKFWLTPVHCAAINGSIKSMEVISVKNSNLKMTDRCGRQPIHLAALFANTEVLCYLLNKGIPVDVVDKHSKTPLHYASFRGHLHVAKLLISQSCDIHLKDRKGYSALHYAAISGNSYIVNYLLQQGLSPNVQSLNGATPFHLASMYLNVSVCEVLKSFGCDVHSLNFHQQNAFHYFALSSTSLSCPSSMKQFVQSNVKKLTSLIKYNPSSKWLTNDSVFFNDDWEVRVEATYNFLAECSIDSNLNDINGMVPLHLSTLVTEQSVCQFLLNDHSKHKLCKNGQSIIHLATSLASKSLCSLYISSGLPIDQKDDLGRLPLHMAALSGDINCLKIFLTHNSMEKFDKNNRNVIFYAIMSDQLDIVEYLLKNGYNLSLYDCNGASPLHYVAKYSKNPELMAYLIKVNQKLLLNKDNFDYSPLVVSIFNENVEVFKTILGEVVSLMKNNDCLNEQNILKDILISSLSVSMKIDKSAVYEAILNHISDDLSLLLQKQPLLNNLNIVHYTTIYGSKTCLQSLIDHIGIKSFLSISPSPLVIAASCGATSLFEVITENFDEDYFKIDTNDDRNLLFYSIESNNNELVEFIIEQTANINQQDHLGLTVLHYSFYLGNISLINLLINHGASILSRDNFNRQPIFYALMNNKIQVFEWYIDEDRRESFDQFVQMDANDSDWWTSLDCLGLSIVHWILLKNHTQLLQWIVLNRPELLLIKSKFPLIHCAVLNGSLEQFKILMNALKDLKCLIEINDSIDRNILHVAASNNHHILADFILQTTSTIYPLMLNSFVNWIDCFGRSPLHLAAFSSSIDIINLLNELGIVDFHLVDKNGDTPLHIACRRCSDIAASSLLQNFKCLETLDCTNLSNCRPYDYIKYNNLTECLAYIKESRKNSSNDEIFNQMSLSSPPKSTSILIESTAEIQLEIMSIHP